MITSLLRGALLLVVAVSFTACEIVGNIFQAGFWIGVIIVVLIIALIGWVFRRGRG